MSDAGCCRRLFDNVPRIDEVETDEQKKFDVKARVRSIYDCIAMTLQVKPWLSSRDPP